MPQAGYLLDCPGCGRQLQHHTGPPQNAPWQCPEAAGGCGRGWWPAELLRPAREAWRGHPYHDHHGLDDTDPERHLRIALVREAQRAVAERRRTSVLPEHLPLLTVAQLQNLAGFLAAYTAAYPAAADLAAQVQAAITAAGG